MVKTFKAATAVQNKDREHIKITKILKAYSSLILRQELLFARAEQVCRETAKLRADTLQFDVDKKNMLKKLKIYDSLGPEAQSLIRKAFRVGEYSCQDTGEPDLNVDV